ncbi:LacI family DNA-binding transcriptional regulator [Aurantimonas sp. VKM B-3413]|uniref:LacI family DNA-binding transcriptional regulator n=1 Tax=Aurantimonas sp. VKM B-3413 TaxID=2779401 RepID=UPI001E3F8682|nr:LacI family DNA-binding transcriptional regulator [Aurantimonas sp. VKM B-3413]MCB8840470.1 LacI family DNA-binding transcriptional regulator [Aurantimonas sp. VKM B-3413]
MEDPSRPTLVDVARAAGVSRATVDRVVNGRPNVRPGTVARVRAAMAKLSYRPDPLAAGLARRARRRFCFILPSGRNAFMADLAGEIGAMSDWLDRNRAVIDCRKVDVFDPVALAAAIDAVERSASGAAIVALDHPLVRAAIDRLVADGVEVVTLVSDAPTSRRAQFVGIDNSAAGRTAGLLVGRFLGGRAGSVGILVGSLALRDHMERCFGFSQLIGRDHPHLTILPIVETRDDDALAEAAASQMIAERADLVALYNAGAGNAGVAAALAAAASEARLVFVGHELTPASRAELLGGRFDAVIAQNAGHEVRSAARRLLASAAGEALIDEQERIRIDIFVRENLPESAG